MEEITSQVHCTNCGEAISDVAEVCTKCGVRQGKVIKHCFNCGGEISENQELCLSCGANPRKMNSIKAKISKSVASQNDEVNVTVATIIGYFIPGLPSLIWYNQKTKGIVFIIATVFCTLIFPLIGNIIFGVFGALDAYQLGKRINQGETLGQWTFFWDK